jgi:hypothetical protein
MDLFRFFAVSAADTPAGPVPIIAISTLSVSSSPFPFPQLLLSQNLFANYILLNIIGLSMGK